MAYSAISSSCSFCKIVKAEFDPSRGVEGNVLVAECMDDIKSHLASCLSVAKSIKMDSF